MTNISSVGIVDCTLTAGQASLWAGKMTNEMLLPILPRLDKAGYRAVELLDPFVFTSCADRLGEDPWERLRLAAKRLAHTPASVSLAGKYLFGTRPVAKKTLRQTLRLLAKNGVSRVDCYDPFNDVESLEPIVEVCNELGLTVCGGVVYALGDAYDAKYFASKAKTLAEFGCNAIALMDFSGILHPERVPEIIAALAQQTRAIPLELRTHCRSSRAEISCLLSLDNGASAIHTASEPLAGGVSLPSADFFAEHLEREGYRSEIDDAAVAAISDYFTGVADYNGLPKGAPLLYDFAVDRDQIPAVLQQERVPGDGFETELARIRADLGDPPMALPVATWICEQARGGSPLKEKLRPEKTACDVATEDDVTALHLSGGAMRTFTEMRSRADRGAWDIHADSPTAQLLAELARRPWVRDILVEHA
jgi:oxaloacetate decarboxylase (Na+ extruding) subunit alpha